MWISEEDILWPKNCLHNNYTMERGQMFKYIGIYLLFAWLELKLRDKISIIFSHKLILICIITVSGFILQQRDIFFKIHNIVKKWKSVYEHHYTCIPSKTAFFIFFFFGWHMFLSLLILSSSEFKWRHRRRYLPDILIFVQLLTCAYA